MEENMATGRRTMDGKRGEDIGVTEVVMKGNRLQNRNKDHRAQGYEPFISGSDFDV